MSDRGAQKNERGRELPHVDDLRVCGLCRRGWGSVIVIPPPDYFSLRNTRTGTYHGVGRNGKTACGKTATGKEWQHLAASVSPVSAAGDGQ